MTCAHCGYKGGMFTHCPICKTEVMTWSKLAEVITALLLLATVMAWPACDCGAHEILGGQHANHP